MDKVTGVRLEPVLPIRPDKAAGTQEDNLVAKEHRPEEEGNLPECNPSEVADRPVVVRIPSEEVGRMVVVESNPSEEGNRMGVEESNPSEEGDRVGVEERNPSEANRLVASRSVAEEVSKLAAEEESRRVASRSVAEEVSRSEAEEVNRSVAEEVSK